jgi:hypothetical protein
MPQYVPQKRRLTLNEIHGVTSQKTETFKYVSALKIPRHCPLILLVEMRLTKGKALGSEDGKVLGIELCYE